MKATLCSQSEKPSYQEASNPKAAYTQNTIPDQYSSDILLGSRNRNMS